MRHPSNALTRIGTGWKREPSSSYTGSSESASGGPSPRRPCVATPHANSAPWSVIASTCADAEMVRIVIPLSASGISATAEKRSPSESSRSTEAELTPSSPHSPLPNASTSPALPTTYELAAPAQTNATGACAATHPSKPSSTLAAFAAVTVSSCAGRFGLGAGVAPPTPPPLLPPAAAAAAAPKSSCRSTASPDPGCPVDESSARGAVASPNFASAPACPSAVCTMAENIDVVNSCATIVRGVGSHVLIAPAADAPGCPSRGNARAAPVVAPAAPAAPAASAAGSVGIGAVTAAALVTADASVAGRAGGGGALATEGGGFAGDASRINSACKGSSCGVGDIRPLVRTAFACASAMILT
mmetsp:Transcript_52080/g.116964  ORF Transcript_52080/g.116964 Transcript_52080/m.116964 type:complete len:359 (-) Transcript_52080:1039-2115(-)